MRIRKRDERGAVAMVVAIASLLILSLAALGVDLGNAYARDRDIQTQADLAALAASIELPRTSTSEAAIKAALQDYASKNFIQGQDEPAWNFNDGDRTNGWVEFPDDDTVRVIAPNAHVDFIFAGAVMPDGMDVSAAATVTIQSPGTVSLPFFAVTGCALGLQTLSDDQTSSSPSGPATLPFSGNNETTSNATVNAVTPDAMTQTAAPTTFLTVTGTGFYGQVGNNGPDENLVREVGFFRDVSKSPSYVAAATYSPPTVFSPTTIGTVPVPLSVANTPDDWYVRVKIQTGNNQQRWTQSSAVFTVEDAAASPTPGWTECPSGSNDGNFGTIDLPRENENKWIERNIATGPDPKLSFDVHPEDGYADPECDKADPLPNIASTSKHDIEHDTNCINTKPGFPGSEVTTGLIEGIDSDDGLLDAPTSPAWDGRTLGCAPDHSTDRWNSGIRRRGNGSPVSINNDVLSCYLTDDLVTLAQITLPDASFPLAAEQVLAPEIFESPRFTWIPVFASDPDNGLKYWKVVDFAPGFITDQLPLSTRMAPLMGPSTTNGLKLSSNGKAIKSIKILMFNKQALPASVAATIPSGNYLGVGTKVPVLIE